MFSMKVKFSLMSFQCFNRPSTNIILNLCPLKCLVLYLVFWWSLCRTNSHKIFITLNFDPVVHVIIRSVHSFTLHCIVLEWYRSWPLNLIRWEPSLCRSQLYPSSLFNCLKNFKYYFWYRGIIMDSCHCNDVCYVILCFVSTLWLFRLVLKII